MHARDKPMAANVALDLVARRTVGFSGASLANLLNEAALHAARNDQKEITYEDIDYALDKVQVGLPEKTGTRTGTDAFRFNGTSSPTEDAGGDSECIPGRAPSALLRRRPLLHG